MLALSDGLVSLCGDLGPRRILKKVVYLRHGPDSQDYQQIAHLGYLLGPHDQDGRQTRVLSP